MGSPVLIALALLLVLLLVGFVAVVRAGPRAPRDRSAMSQRERAVETQIMVEEHDIAEMIEARNEIRRRRGKPTIGEELGERALRPDDED